MAGTSSSSCSSSSERTRRSERASRRGATRPWTVARRCSSCSSPKESGSCAGRDEGPAIEQLRVRGG
eukprot:4191389-Prymnesium_polylepis.1